MNESLDKFFDTIRPLRDLITHEQYSAAIDAAVELSKASYMYGRQEVKDIYKIDTVMPPIISTEVANAPETHSMNC